MRISREEARGFLARQCLLGPGTHTESPEDVVGHLGMIQVDPMVVVEKSHQLALHARLPSHQPADLEDALYNRRTLVEALAAVRCIVPMSDLPYFRSIFRSIAQSSSSKVGQLEPWMDKVRDRLSRKGPMTSLDFQERDKISGWWDPDGVSGTRAVRQALEWLWCFGEVMVVGRRGNARLFDLAGRVAPTDMEVSEEESRRYLENKFFRCQGLFGLSHPHLGYRRYRAQERRQAIRRGLEEGMIKEVEIHGTNRPYFLHVAATHLLEPERPAEGGRMALLPPLDNLLWDRSQLEDIYGFSYRWEAYVPRERREYGPYTMPILWDDQLVGRVDARADRKKGALVVNGVWWEEAGQGEDLASSLEECLTRLASFSLGVSHEKARIEWPG